MVKNKDFQEFLNEEIVNSKKEGSINRYYSALLEALENAAKEKDGKGMMEQFIDAASESDSSTSSEETSQKIIEAAKEAKALDGEDELITGAGINLSNEDNDEIEEEEVEKEETFGEEISDEELEEAYPDTDLSKNAKRYALTYERVMEQYYKLKTQLEKQNLRYGKYSYDDKYFRELMQLKTVAINYEVYFRNATRGKYFAVADAIDSVKSMQEKNEIEIDRYQDQNNKMHEKQNTRVNDVVIQIEECLKKIEDLNNELQSASSEEKGIIMHQLSEVQAMYIKLNERLELIKPNPNELAKEEERSRAQSEIEKEVDGVHFTKYVNRYAEESKINNAKYLSQEKARVSKEERLDENGALSSIAGAEEKLENAKKEGIESIQEEIEKGNLESAERLANNYVATYSQDFDKSDDKSVKELESVKKDIEKMKEERDRAIDNNEFSKDTMHSDELAEKDALSEDVINQLESLSKGERLNKESQQKDLEEK